MEASPTTTSSRAPDTALDFADERRMLLSRKKEFTSALDGRINALLGLKSAMESWGGTPSIGSLVDEILVGSAVIERQYKENATLTAVHLPGIKKMVTLLRGKKVEIHSLTLASSGKWDSDTLQPTLAAADKVIAAAGVVKKRADKRYIDTVAVFPADDNDIDAKESKEEDVVATWGTSLDE